MPQFFIILLALITPFAIIFAVIGPCAIAVALDRREPDNSEDYGR